MSVTQFSTESWISIYKYLLKVSGYTPIREAASDKVFANNTSPSNSPISYTQLVCWCNTFRVIISLALPSGRYSITGVAKISLSYDSLLKDRPNGGAILVDKR